MAPYHHFENKAALLAAMAQQGFQALYKAMQKALEQTESEPLKRLQATGVAYVLYATSNPVHYQVMFAPSISDRRNYPELYASAVLAFELLQQVLIQCQQAQCITSEEPRKLAQLLWSLVHGLATLLIDSQFLAMGCVSEQEMAQFATWKIIEGLQLNRC